MLITSFSRRHGVYGSACFRFNVFRLTSKVVSSRTFLVSSPFSYRSRSFFSLLSPLAGITLLRNPTGVNRISYSTATHSTYTTDGSVSWAWRRKERKAAAAVVVVVAFWFVIGPSHPVYWFISFLCMLCVCGYVCATISFVCGYISLLFLLLFLPFFFRILFNVVVELRSLDVSTTPWQSRWEEREVCIPLI